MRLGAPLIAASMLAAIAVVAAGCAVINPGATVCPAIAYSTAVKVTLDQAWPERDDLLLDVQCVPGDDGPCDLSGTADGPEWEGMSVSLPNAVHVTVRRGAEVLAQQEVPLSTRTIDYPNGKGCPGVQAAEGAVPPPS
jgi:hypothetical protein